MGIYDSKITKTAESTAITPVHHGGNAITSDQALNPANLVTAMSEINWAGRDYVPVASKPVLSSVAEADRAEDEAKRYAIGVDNGVRSMKATEDRLQKFAQLERAYCKMLATAGKSAAEVLASRRALAGVLQDQRAIVANLGFGLDRQIERTDNDVALIAESYGRA